MSETKTRTRLRAAIDDFLASDAHGPDLFELERASGEDVKNAIAALEARHAEEVSNLHERNADLRERLSDANEELATLRAKLAGMVCKKCLNGERILSVGLGHLVPCPVFQPKVAT